MNNIYQNYQIDLSGNNNFVQYNTIQGDGNEVRRFEIELIENNKPYIISDDVEVFIAGTKPDTKQIFNSCEITNEGKILIDITSQMSAVLGRSDYQIVLISKTNNQQLKSFPFIIYVKKAAFDVESVTSSNEFNALNGMVNKIESTLNKTDLVDSMLESSSKILDDTTTAYDNAVKSIEKAQEAIDTAESINSTARESADNAKQSEENSLLYSNLAKSYAVGTNDEIRENDSVDNAKYYKEQAELNSASASQSANLAGQKADDASLSETNAQQYALNAANSESNAKISEENAKNSEENALNSETNAMQSAANSENSAAKSAQSAEKALESATNASTSESSARSYAESAAESAAKAEEIVNISIATQEKNGIAKPDGTTITIDEDGTLHGAVAGLTVNDLSNAPSPTVNGITDVAFTGTDASQDPPALKSVSLSELSKGVADEIDSELLLQNYVSKTDFTESQAHQDEKITLNSDNIETLTTRLSAVEENGVTSADLSNYLPLTGGTMASNAKIDFAANTDVAIYYGKINNHQGLVIGDNGEDNNSVWTLIANDVKTLNTLDALSDVNVDGELNTHDVYVNGQLYITNDLILTGNLLKNGFPYISYESQNNIQDYIYGFESSTSNRGNIDYNILKFANGLMILSIYRIRPISGGYDFYLPISFIDNRYHITFSFQFGAYDSQYVSGYYDISSRTYISNKSNNFFSVSTSSHSGTDNEEYVEAMVGCSAICIGRWR